MEKCNRDVIAEDIEQAVCVGMSGDLPTVVDGHSGAAWAAKCSQIRHLVSRRAIDECMAISLGGIGFANDLPGVVNVIGGAGRAAERSQIGDGITIERQCCEI